MTVEKRLENIRELEDELLRKGAGMMSPGTPITLTHLYAVGATSRTIAQSKGFRALISERNFPCAAIILRTQIDTAMRINGIRFLPAPHEQIGKILSGETTFRRLKSTDGKQMNDVFLREKLAESYPWVNKVYEETSDFVHLSFRHLWPAVHSTDDESSTVTFAISGEDNVKSDSDYDEICDAFFAASKLTSTMILGLLMALGQAK